jgi:hypothetical protein
MRCFWWHWRPALGGCPSTQSFASAPLFIWRTRRRPMPRRRIYGRRPGPNQAVLSSQLPRARSRTVFPAGMDSDVEPAFCFHLSWLSSGEEEQTEGKRRSVGCGRKAGHCQRRSCSVHTAIKSQGGNAAPSWPHPTAACWCTESCLLDQQYAVNMFLNSNVWS